jgi:hypothetical protein
MSDTATLTRKVPALVATLLMLCSAAALMPSTASAYYANEIGQQLPAEVSCYAPTDKVVVTPRVGTGTYWNAQWVGARSWIYNARTGKSVWLTPAGKSPGEYTWFMHNRVQQLPYGGFGSPQTSETLFAIGPTNSWIIGSDIKSLSDYEFYVYTQYAWNTTTGIVYGSPIKTTTYFNGWGPLAYCGL